MKNYKSWVVAIDFTEMDSNLLKYTSFLATLMKPSHIHLIHVEKDREANSYVPVELDELRHQLAMDSQLQMEHKMATFFQDTAIKCTCHVRSGNALDEIIGFVKEKSIGLVIAGRKKASDGSGIVSDRLSMNLPCDFLLVPEHSLPRLGTILIPTDFSQHADLAMQRAMTMKADIKDVELIALHLYSVPWGYTKTGKSFEEFAEIMKGNAAKEMSKWIKGFASSRSTLKLVEKSVQQAILEVAGDHKADLLIMGSKGQSKASYALLGSNTMKVMKGNDSIPLLIVKIEGENLNLIDALSQV